MLMLMLHGMWDGLGSATAQSMQEMAATCWAQGRREERKEGSDWMSRVTGWNRWV